MTNLHLFFPTYEEKIGIEFFIKTIKNEQVIYCAHSFWYFNIYIKN